MGVNGIVKPAEVENILRSLAEAHPGEAQVLGQYIAQLEREAARLQGRLELWVGDPDAGDEWESDEG